MFSNEARLTVVFDNDATTSDAPAHASQPVSQVTPTESRHHPQHALRGDLNRVDLAISSKRHDAHAINLMKPRGHLPPSRLEETKYQRHSYSSKPILRLRRRRRQRSLSV